MVHEPVSAPDHARPAVSIRVERRRLAKRVWRARAADGAEFGFELATPLQPGQTVFQTADRRYVVEQEPEPVLVVALPELPASAAAGIGWAVGNLHLELQAEPERLLTPDEPAARQLLERISIPFTPTTAVFRPGRFARRRSEVSADSISEYGSSHRH